MELTTEQQKSAETKLRALLPLAQTVYGFVLLRNRVQADPAQVFVDSWPDFSVCVCKPTQEQDGDHFKDILCFGKDRAAAEKIIRNCDIFDWTQFLCVGTSAEFVEIFKAVATEKQGLFRYLSVCHMMVLKDVSCLSDINCSGVPLGSLDESHTELINQTWKFGQKDAERMIRNMLKNFPSCCVLDTEGRPVSWVLTYASCAMGMLYTVPEHRGKGYATAVVSALSRLLHAEGYPVFCFIEEENTVSFHFFKKLGFTEDPSFRHMWFDYKPKVN